MSNYIFHLDLLYFVQYEVWRIGQCWPVKRFSKANKFMRLIKSQRIHANIWMRENLLFFEFEFFLWFATTPIRTGWRYFNFHLLTTLKKVKAGRSQFFCALPFLLQKNLLCDWLSCILFFNQIESRKNFNHCMQDIYTGIEHKVITQLLTGIWTQWMSFAWKSSFFSFFWKSVEL